MGLGAMPVGRGWAQLQAGEKLSIPLGEGRQSSPHPQAKPGEREHGQAKAGKREMRGHRYRLQRSGSLWRKAREAGQGKTEGKGVLHTALASGKGAHQSKN